MNSWHSFSSNGRWLVFSSKANTPYTQLFLTHIDDEGNSTPPVVLERFTGADRAANIPEFVPVAADTIAKIKEQFLDAYSFLRAGMANERTGNYPGAVRLYRRGLEIEPRNVELLNAIGFALFQDGKSQEASVELEKALAIDPKHWKAHNNMALASIDLGELELAEAHYRESLAIQPQPAIYNDLGFVLERLGMTDDAAAAYRKALELDPGLSSAHYNLGTSMARSGAYAAAEKHFRAALRTNPNAQTYTGLGVVLARQGRVDEAVTSLQSAIEADPKNDVARQELAQLQASQGHTDEARRAMELAGKAGLGAGAAR
jgi:Flp pilus assembly protein TadD